MIPHCVRVGGTGGGKEQTHICEMRDFTSPSGSDIGGYTVVYAGKTHLPFGYTLNSH